MIYEKFALPERCVGQTLHVATTLKQFAHTVAQKTGTLLHQPVAIYILSIEQIKFKLLTIKKGLSQNKKAIPQKGRDELVLSSSLLCTIKV